VYLSFVLFFSRAQPRDLSETWANCAGFHGQRLEVAVRGCRPSGLAWFQFSPSPPLHINIKSLSKSFSGPSHWVIPRLAPQVVPLTDEFKCWADLAALSHGGSDMLAVDAVVDADGNKFIIEINGS
jgi:hypothetical protein